MTANDADTPRPAGPSWLERVARKRWARWLVVLLVLPTLALIALVLYLAHVFMEDEPVVYSKIEEHFKYGSTGGYAASGFPYWIWKAMPVVFKDRLPQNGGKGYEATSLDQLAAEGVRSHISRYWEPRMRREILAHLDVGGASSDRVGFPRRLQGVRPVRRGGHAVARLRQMVGDEGDDVRLVVELVVTHPGLPSACASANPGAGAEQR